MEYQKPNVDLTRIFTPLQMFQYYDKYSKFLHAEGRRERWDETVARSVDQLRRLSNDQYPFETYQEMYDLIYLGEVSPSMRLFAHAGEAIERNNEMLYNCSYHVIDTTDAFSEFLWLSMCGCGIATSVESKFVNKLPPVAPKIDFDSLYILRDDAESWKYSVLLLINDLWYSGRNVVFDYSRIRPEGAPLYTKGGYSSGPGVLKEIHEYIRKVLDKAQGRKLTTLEVFDLFTKLPDAGISGGVRRAAALCLFDYDDELMLKAKYDGFWANPEHAHRANANISAVWPDNVTKKDVEELTHDLFNTGTGEPGFFKRSNAINTAPARRRFRYPELVGTNASLRGDTLVPTANGVYKIQELEGQSIEVLNLHSEWKPARCFKTGNNKQLWKITLSGGVEYFCTHEHDWPVYDMKTKNSIKTPTYKINSGDRIPVNTIPSIGFGNKGNYSDGFFIGWLYGDGWVTQRSDNGKQQIGMMVSADDAANGVLEILQTKLKEIGSNAIFHPRHDTNLPRYNMQTQNETLNRWLENFGVSKKIDGLPKMLFNEATLDFINGFVDGLISSDGCVTKQRVTVVTAHEQLANDLHRLLGLLGVISNKQQRNHYNNFSRGQHYTSYTIRFSTRFKFSLTHQRKANNYVHNNGNTKSYRQVISVEPTNNYEDVWDITVDDDTHCFSLDNCITGNCGEIQMSGTPEHDGGGGGQFCNLTTVICKPKDTYETLLRKTEVATIMGGIQSLATKFNLRHMWGDLCREDRLLGVNHIGHATSKVIRDPQVQKYLLDAARATDMEFAEKFGVPESASITAVKPSGNSSVLFNVGPGVNPIHNHYSVRNVTVTKSTAMYRFLKDYGVPFNEYPGRDSHVMFAFPYKAPKDAITLDDVTALEQLEYWLQVKNNLTEHNPSCSIIYRDGEEEGIKRWLYHHQDDIGGLTFFPHFDNSYALCPVQESTEELYNRLIKNMPTIEWDILADYEIKDESTRVLECSGGRCDIPT